MEKNTTLKQDPKNDVKIPTPCGAIWHLVSFLHLGLPKVVLGFRLDTHACTAPTISNAASPSCVEGTDAWHNSPGWRLLGW